MTGMGKNFTHKANKKVEQLYKVSSTCLDDHPFKQEEVESVGECQKFAHNLS